MANNLRGLKCSIPGCKTRSGQNKNIQLHRIRKCIKESNKEKKKWLKALPFMSNEDFLKKNYLICSLHYTDDDYIFRKMSNLRQAWELKLNAIPTMNLPGSNSGRKTRRKRGAKLQLETDADEITDFNDILVEIESMNDTGSVQITKFDCGKLLSTANVGIQCDLFGSFGYNDVEEFLDENIEIIEQYMERRKKVAASYNTICEDEILREINEVEVTEDKKSNERTCDLPSDDVFFNEISNINNQQKLSKTDYTCCQECGMIFSDIRSYRDHEGVHDEISLLCFFCGECSPDYMKHIEHEYRCEKIKKIENGEIIPTTTKRKKLKSIANNIDTYNDDLNESIITQNNVNNDDLNKPKDKESFVTYSCRICHKLFQNEDTLTEHYNAHITFNEYTDNTEIRDESHFSNEYKLTGDTTIEFLSYSKNQSNNFKCAICEKSYATEYLLNRHIDIKHLNPTQKNLNFHCNECPKTFRNLQKFQSHIKEHAVTLKTCKICDLTHDDNIKYLKHLRNSNHLILEENWKDRLNIKLFACPLCKTEENAYNKLADLASHSDYHRISKTRTFINSSLAEHEINFLKFSKK